MKLSKFCKKQRTILLGGLKMNAKKTEIMVIGKDTSQHPLPQNRAIDITVDGNSAKQVTQFTYLGDKITSDGKID